jgi:hypothetical protein
MDLQIFPDVSEERISSIMGHEGLNLRRCRGKNLASPCVLSRLRR